MDAFVSKAKASPDLWQPEDIEKRAIGSCRAVGYTQQLPCRSPKLFCSHRNQTLSNSPQTATSSICHNCFKCADATGSREENRFSRNTSTPSREKKPGLRVTTSHPRSPFLSFASIRRSHSANYLWFDGDSFHGGPKTLPAPPR